MNHPDPDAQRQKFLVLSGEGVGSLTTEHIAALRHVASVMAGGLSVEASTAVDLESIGLQPETDPEPVPVTKADFISFASEQGYTEMRARRSWGALSMAALRQDIVDDATKRLPRIKYLNFVWGGAPEDADERTLDLRSVYDRLIASELRREAWGRTAKYDLSFVIHLVNERLQLEEPLPFARPEAAACGE